MIYLPFVMLFSILSTFSPLASATDFEPDSETQSFLSGLSRNAYQICTRQQQLECIGISEKQCVDVVASSREFCVSEAKDGLHKFLNKNISEGIFSGCLEAKLHQAGTNQFQLHLLPSDPCYQY